MRRCYWLFVAWMYVCCLLALMLTAYALVPVKRHVRYDEFGLPASISYYNALQDIEYFSSDATGQRFDHLVVRVQGLNLVFVDWLQDARALQVKTQAQQDRSTRFVSLQQLGPSAIINAHIAFQYNRRRGEQETVFTALQRLGSEFYRLLPHPVNL